MLTSGWFWLSVVVTIFLVTGGRESISVRKRRRRHVLGHPPVTDEQFLAELGVADNDADRCLAFRQAWAD